MKLLNFQETGAGWLAQHRRAILADEMGTGKTIQALNALNRLPDPTGCDAHAALVVCPAFLKLNWEREAEIWAPDHKVEVISGSKNFRSPEPGEIVIANYEILPETFAPFAPFALILDEAHYVKNSQTARTKRSLMIARKAAYVWALTGMPMTNEPFDLYSVVSVLGLSFQIFYGGRSPWHQFLSLFGGYKNRWGGYDFARTPHYSVPARLEPYMLRRLRKEVLPELPDKMRTYIPVEVPKSIEKILDELEVDEKVAASLAADKLPPFEMFSAVRAALAASRIKAAFEIAENYAKNNEKPLVVFSAHLAPVEAFGQLDGWRTITGATPTADRQAAVDSFQSGKLQGIAITIAAGGVGITLTVADTVLFVDRSWTPAENSQAEDRLCRIGQTSQKINVLNLVSNHRLDRLVEELLRKKAALAVATLGDEL